MQLINLTLSALFINTNITLLVINTQHIHDVKHHKRSFPYFFGGGDGARTHDLLNANQALSQAELHPQNQLKTNLNGGPG